MKRVEGKACLPALCSEQSGRFQSVRPVQSLAWRVCQSNGQRARVGDFENTASTRGGRHLTSPGSVSDAHRGNLLVSVVLVVNKCWNIGMVEWTLNPDDGQGRRLWL